ncbi:putative leader peptide [Streptomyces sp. NPDC055287]
MVESSITTRHATECRRDRPLVRIGDASRCRSPAPGLDRCAVPPSRSGLPQPLGDYSVRLVARRHVDLVRVASAVCRCAQARFPQRPQLPPPSPSCGPSVAGLCPDPAPAGR